MVERNAPSLTVRTLLCTRTISPEALLKPALSTIVSARLDSPSYCWALVGLLVPAAWPSTSARATKASHPKMAVFLWRGRPPPAPGGGAPGLVWFGVGGGGGGVGGGGGGARS